MVKLVTIINLTLILSLIIISNWCYFSSAEIFAGLPLEGLTDVTEITRVPPGGGIRPVIDPTILPCTDGVQWCFDMDEWICVDGYWADANLRVKCKDGCDGATCSGAGGGLIDIEIEPRTCPSYEWICQDTGNLLWMPIGPCDPPYTGIYKSHYCGFGCTVQPGDDICNPCPTATVCSDSAGTVIENDHYYMTCTADGVNWDLENIVPCSTGDRTDSTCVSGVCQVVCSVGNRYCLDGNIYDCADEYTYSAEPVEICANGCSTETNQCNAGASASSGGGGSGSHRFTPPRLAQAGNITANTTNVPTEQTGPVCKTEFPALFWVVLAGLIYYNRNRIRSRLK